MNTELVFFDAHRLADVVFHRVAFAILDSFKQYHGEYMNMALVFNNKEDIDPDEFRYEHFELVSVVQLNGYTKKEGDRHVTQNQFCGIALLDHDEDDKSIVVVEIPGNNVRYKIEVVRMKGRDGYDTLVAELDTERIFITNIDELLEEEPIVYYGKIISSATAEIVENQCLARIIETDDGRQMFEYRL